MALKGIERVVNKFTVQTAVYWGNPVDDGFGSMTFDDPIELAPPNGVRWDEKQEVKVGPGGNEFTSQSKVLVNQDVDRQGYLYLGSLSDFDSSVDISKPKTIKGAYIIQQFEKIPFVKKTDEFVRTAFLYDEG